MPQISRFLGISLMMYYNDHLPPHFHVRYNQQKALIRISPPSLLAGELSTKVTNLVIEWANLHQVELLENWELTTKNQPLKMIQPLE
ncbi:Transcriptional regulator [Tumidithrix helvetica PCC 7403]|uniref:DUF4160 domain-containing protein n=1 Tax=Tumidithrix helvetica TaxID=3457545 RepID=UPI003CAC665F